MSPILNLADADTSEPTFVPVPSGPYEAVVFEAKMGETQGGKLPAGTPFVNVQYKITDERLAKIKESAKAGEIVSDRVFDRYIFAPDKVDGKKYQHKAMMDGQLVRWLIALGYDESEVKADNVELDMEDLAGRECVLVLGVESYQSREVDDAGEPITKTRNVVKGVKKFGSVNTGAASGGKGLI